MADSKTSCKNIACSTLLKMRGPDKAYMEAIEASSKFNRRMLHERKSRLPFIDSQTRVAQANSLMWYNETHRDTTNTKAGIVQAYPVKSWIKNRRLQFDVDLNLARLPSYESSSSSHHINDNSNSTDSYQPVMYNNRYSTTTTSFEHEHSMTDEWHAHDEQLDYYNDNNDDNNDSDFDDYEDSRRKKGKKSRVLRKRSEITSDEKPFVCDKCGVKYKTKPGLTYHVQKMHSKNNAKNSLNNNQQFPMQQQQHANQAVSSHSNHVGHSSADTTNSDSNRTQSHLNQDENTNETNEDSNQAHLTSKASKMCTSCGASQIDNVEIKQRNGGDSQMIPCCECTRVYHPVCLNFTPNMIISTKKYDWQCIECKKCVVCGNSENDDKLLFCDDCDRGYHMYCLNPPMIEAPDGDWRCKLCIEQFGTQ